MGVFVSGFQIYLLTDNYEAFESHLSPSFGVVSAKRRKGPFCLSDVGMICSLLHYPCLFAHFLLIQHHTSEPTLDFPFHSCCAMWAIFRLSSTYAEFWTKFLPLLPGQSAVLPYIGLLSLR